MQAEPHLQQTFAQTQQPQQPAHIDISTVEYTFFAAVLFMCAGIIGFFIKSAFKSLTQSNGELRTGLTTSNSELRASIEKLATAVADIHTDLIEYKVEVAENYASKEDLQSLKKDIRGACSLRHNRRSTDRRDDEGHDLGLI